MEIQILMTANKTLIVNKCQQHSTKNPQYRSIRAARYPLLILSEFSHRNRKLMVTATTGFQYFQRNLSLLRSLNHATFRHQVFIKHKLYKHMCSLYMKRGGVPVKHWFRSSPYINQCHISIQITYIHIISKALLKNMK